MPSSIAEFARSVSAAYRTLEGFEATERIRAGAIDVEARVRFRKPSQCAVEVQSYHSPLAELEERLANGAEFTGDELTGMTFCYDGHTSWAFDPKGKSAVRKPERSLPEPLPGLRALAEIGFLETLTRDFLVRDAGEETIDGERVRLLGLRPKEPHRSHLLKVVSFPIRRATIAIDDAGFPRRIESHPSPATLLASLLGRDPVVIRYENVRRDPPDQALFSPSPPEGAHVFREAFASVDKIEESLPFPFSFTPLTQRGYRPLAGGGTVTVDEEHDRGYCTVSLGVEDDGATQRAVTLRVGNYLSRNMSRRRVALAERGEPVRLGTIDGKLLDRGREWTEQTGEETPRALVEAFWNDDGIYAFLLGDGVEREELVTLASALVSSNDGPEEAD